MRGNDAIAFERLGIEHRKPRSGSLMTATRIRMVKISGVVRLSPVFVPKSTAATARTEGIVLSSEAAA